jgi:hypothetical protein
MAWKKRECFVCHEEVYIYVKPRSKTMQEHKTMCSNCYYGRSTSSSRHSGEREE